MLLYILQPPFSKYSLKKRKRNGGGTVGYLRMQKDISQHMKVFQHWVCLVFFFNSQAQTVSTNWNLIETCSKKAFVVSDYSSKLTNAPNLRENIPKQICQTRMQIKTSMNENYFWGRELFRCNCNYLFWFDMNRNGSYIGSRMLLIIPLQGFLMFWCCVAQLMTSPAST